MPSSLHTVTSAVLRSLSRRGGRYEAQERLMDRKPYSKPTLESLDVRETHSIDIGIEIEIGLS